MELALAIVMLLVGILFIVKGGDFFVDAASWMAEVSGIPKLIVGATVVSVATTLPELLVSVMAATEGKVDMSIGNAVGSVTANLGLIMALSLMFMPGAIRRKDYLLKSVLMLVAAGLICLCGYWGEIGPAVSVLFLAIFLVFLFENVTAARSAMVASRTDSAAMEARPSRDGKTVAVNLLKFVIGAVGIVWGADLLVDNASILARYMGVSERIIGVTIVAVGTSLPELITTVTAIVKKQSALSVGNILGANILDLALIMPLSSLISGQSLPISAVSATVDLPACLLVGAIAVIPAMIRSKFSRWQGFALLAVYAGYLFVTCTLL